MCQLPEVGSHLLVGKEGELISVPAKYQAARVVAGIWGMTLLANANLGCLSEQSFRLGAEDIERFGLDGRNAVEPATARAWLCSTHEQLSHLLPAGSADALLTADLTDDTGDPVDVFRHFGIRCDRLRSLLGNLRGITCTAQGASQEYHIDKPAPAWHGFEDVWIPIEKRLALSGRLGYARADGAVLDADCIVILPGLFGDNGVTRTRDLAIFLRESGHHVLALEIRGHGRTEAKYPKMSHTFGVMETDDLMQVADWLEGFPHVRGTGLVGYCWGANIALLAGWYEAHTPDDPGVTEAMRGELLASVGRRRYTAGIIAFSPIPCWERLMDELETPRSVLTDPVCAALQGIVRDRTERKGYPDRSGSLRALIEYEYKAQGADLPRGVAEGYPFLRFMPYRGRSAFDKLGRARVPTLIVHAGDDPLSPAQDVADLISGVDNPMVAAVILPSGGHVGFAAYAKRYYFSLIANFFDPVVGAAATIARQDARHSSEQVARSPNAAGAPPLPAR